MKKWLLIVTAFVFASCSNTQITSSWSNKNAPSTHFNKILVLALLPDNSRGIQQAMEISMVNQLRKKGFQATSAFDQYGPKAFANLDESKSIARVKQDGVDAVMTISLMDKTRQRSYVPDGWYPGPYWGYWGGGMFSPGYYTVNTNYIWESNLYTVSDNKMRYSVQTQSFDPSSARSLARQYSKKIVNDMLSRGVLR